MALRTPLYFGPETDSLFGWLHWPKSQTSHQTPLVICPPIGHEYVHSHRSLRHLSDHLANLGFPTLRFDYHGTGDSGGLNQDLGRVDAWLDSIRQAIAVLKRVSGCSEISLLGLRMGATFAGMIASQMEVQSLILWEPVIQGRRFVRELKALHLTATAYHADNLSESGDIEPAGFVISRQTAEDLGQLNLKNITPKAAHVLIGERDDVVDDSRLRDVWSEHGINVEYTRLAGYVDMMAEAQFTIVPTQAITQIGEWLSAKSNDHSKSSSASPDLAMLRDETRISHHNFFQQKSTVSEESAIRECILSFGEKHNLFGIVSQPKSDAWKRHPTIILLNSGSVHHIGPHRLYVFLSRQLAQMGFRCLRLDMAGIGDSVIDDIAHENHPYTKTAIHDVGAAISALKQEQQDSSFVLMGVCSGAYASFHASIEIPDEKVIECVLINPLTFYWKEGMSLETPSEAHYRQWSDYMISMRKWDKWLKLLRGGVSITEIIRTLLERIYILVSVTLGDIKKKFQKKNIKYGRQDYLPGDLRQIANMNRHITFIFSELDPSYDLLITNAKPAVNELKKKGKLSMYFIDHADHTFSKNATRSVAIDNIILHLARRYLS